MKLLNFLLTIFQYFEDVFREFFDDHAELFVDAPQIISGEQNIQYYALFQKYLKLYELHLSSYIKSLDVSVEEFYAQLVEVKNDASIKDKKLLHFVNYLLACTDYESFYKVMVRAAKRVSKSEVNIAESKSESKTSDFKDSKSFGDKKSSHK